MAEYLVKYCGYSREITAFDHRAAAEDYAETYLEPDDFCDGSVVHLEVGKVVDGSVDVWQSVSLQASLIFRVI